MILISMNAVHMWSSVGAYNSKTFVRLKLYFNHTIIEGVMVVALATDCDWKPIQFLKEFNGNWQKPKSDSNVFQDKLWNWNFHWKLECTIAKANLTNRAVK